MNFYSYKYISLVTTEVEDFTPKLQTIQFIIFFGSLTRIILNDSYLSTINI